MQRSVRRHDAKVCRQQDQRATRILLAARVKDSIFARDVQMNCVFPSGSEGAFVEALRELSGGEELCIVGEPMFGEL